MYVLSIDKTMLACSEDLGKLMDNAREIVGRHYDLCNANNCSMSVWQGRDSQRLLATIHVNGYDRGGNKYESDPEDPSILSIVKVDEI